MELPNISDRFVSSRRYEASDWAQAGVFLGPTNEDKAERRSQNLQKNNSTPHLYQQMLGVWYRNPDVPFAIAMGLHEV